MVTIGITPVEVLGVAVREQVDHIAVAYLTAYGSNLSELRLPLIERTSLTRTGHIYPEPVGIRSCLGHIRAQQFLVRYGKIVVADHGALQVIGHRQVAERKILVAEHVFAHLQDRSAPRGSRSRSHKHAGRIEIALAFECQIVIHVRRQHGLLAFGPLGIVGDDVREHFVAVGIAVLPNLRIAEIHR